MFHVYHPAIVCCSYVFVCNQSYVTRMDSCVTLMCSCVTRISLVCTPNRMYMYSYVARMFSHDRHLKDLSLITGFCYYSSEYQR